MLRYPGDSLDAAESLLWRPWFHHHDSVLAGLCLINPSVKLMQGDLLVSGSTDRTLRVRGLLCSHGLRAGLVPLMHICMHACMQKLAALTRADTHTHTLWNVQGYLLHNKETCMLTCGCLHYGTQLWNMSEGRCLHTLRGHQSTVRCVKIRGTKIMSGSRDQTVSHYP